MINFFHSLWNELFLISSEELAILLFFFVLLSELIISVVGHLSLYKTKETLGNIAIGVLSFTTDLVFSLLTLPLLFYIYQHFQIWHFNAESTYEFIILFLVIDFIEYWFHRFSHEVNIFWSAHVVHHQSENFNLTVGLRTSFVVPLFNIFFYLPIPILGFHPNDIMTVIFIQGVYQLFIHTQLIGKLGILDRIFVTPSIHRVHHGSNEKYLDKNYGKVFLIWDYIFDTFEPETEKVIYGLTEPMNCKNFLLYILQPYRQLKVLLKENRDRKTRLHILFGKPKDIYDKFPHRLD